MLKALALGSFAALAFGCGTEPTIVPNQSWLVAAPAGADLAIQTIMADWGMRERPAVYWYGGAALDCANGHGWTNQIRGCIRGISDSQVILVSAEDNGDHVPIHWLSLTHEMAHMASEQRGEGGDQAHDGHFFNYPDGHEDLTNVDDGDAGLEERRLAAMGL